jgi:hypothetical protein
MGIETKSLGTLIDELVTTSMKCWFAQETVMHGKSEKEVAKAAKLAQKTNARRNALIQAIDLKQEDSESSPLEKTYE